MPTALHTSARNMVTHLLHADHLPVGHFAVLGDDSFLLVKKLAPALVFADEVVSYLPSRLESLRALLDDEQMRGLSTSSRGVCADLDVFGSFDWFGGIPSSYLRDGRLYQWL